MKGRLKIDQRFSEKQKREHVSSALHCKRLLVVNRHPLRIQLFSHRFDSIEAFSNRRYFKNGMKFFCFLIQFKIILILMLISENSIKSKPK